MSSIFGAEPEEDFPFELKNMEESTEFFYNARGQKLHVRSYWPENPKAIVIFLHGFAGHANRPIHGPISTEMVQNDYAYLTFDFHGHGYSEGIKASLMEASHLDDDVVSLLFHLYRKKDSDNTIFDSDVCNLTRRAYGIPFYFMGHSLGGTVAIRLGNRLFNTTAYSFGVFFKGCILLSPLIRMNLPAPLRRAFLDMTVVKLFPMSFIPSTLRRSPQREETFSNRKYIDYITADEYPENPDGLSYAGPVRFKTASSMLHLVVDMGEVVKEVAFPFVILHDDRDSISLVEGVKDIMRDSRTSQNRKTYNQVNRGKHDVITNKMANVLPKIIEFMNSETSLNSGSVLEVA